MIETTVRPATEADIPALLEIAQAFIAESALPYRYDHDNAVLGFTSFIDHDEAAALVAVGPGGVVGMALLAKDSLFVTKPVGYLVKFYVAREGRRTRAGRQLAEACAAWFDEQGCVDAWTTATAGIGQDPAFLALMRKVRFEVVAPCLRREAQHG